MADAESIRQRMVQIGRLLYERRYVVAAEGNLSVKLTTDRFLVTPSGRCKGWLCADDLLEVSADGTVGAGSGGASSEWGLHREIYARRADVGAVCHAHPPYATACAAAGLALDCRVLTEAAVWLGDVPVAPPALPGTPDVAASVRPFVARHDAILLGNHGVVTYGVDLDEAYFKLEGVERLAQVTLLARAAGGPHPLPVDVALAAGLLREDRSVRGHRRETDPDHDGEHQQ